jgi:hypothetical protein
MSAHVAERHRRAIIASHTLKLTQPCPGTYQIVALLPVEQGEPQYRVKSLSEAHERAARSWPLPVRR